RVAVYVDCPAGILSFYRVSSDSLIHLHTFNTTFTEPLYAGFGLWSLGSSVCSSVCSFARSEPVATSGLSPSKYEIIHPLSVSLHPCRVPWRLVPGENLRMLRENE
ncbi:hypothetical protein CHARACLAT_027277, partial [Characodon lateralis]|nr:hypothetical protein [Characodon lateralis]